MCDSGTFVSIKEAAHFLETTEARVLMMLKRNELHGKMEDDEWFIDKISLGLCEIPEAAVLARPGRCGGGCGSGCGGH